MPGGARCVCTVSLVSTPGTSTVETYSLVKDWSYEDTQAARMPEMHFSHETEMFSEIQLVLSLLPECNFNRKHEMLNSQRW